MACALESPAYRTVHSSSYLIIEIQNRARISNRLGLQGLLQQEKMGIPQSYSVSPFFLSKFRPVQLAVCVMPYSGASPHLTQTKATHQLTPFMQYMQQHDPQDSRKQRPHPSSPPLPPSLPPSLLPRKGVRYHSKMAAWMMFLEAASSWARILSQWLAMILFWACWWRRARSRSVMRSSRVWAARRVALASSSCLRRSMSRFTAFWEWMYLMQRRWSSAAASFSMAAASRRTNRLCFSSISTLASVICLCSSLMRPWTSNTSLSPFSSRRSPFITNPDSSSPRYSPFRRSALTAASARPMASSTAWHSSSQWVRADAAARAARSQMASRVSLKRRTSSRTSASLSLVARLSARRSRRQFWRRSCFWAMTALRSSSSFCWRTTVFSISACACCPTWYFSVRTAPFSPLSPRSTPRNRSFSRASMRSASRRALRRLVASACRASQRTCASCSCDPFTRIFWMAFWISSCTFSCPSTASCCSLSIFPRSCAVFICASMLGKLPSEIGKYGSGSVLVGAWTVGGWARGAWVPRAGLRRRSANWWRVWVETRLSSRGSARRWALLARAGKRACAPTSPISFQRRSSTLRARALRRRSSASRSACWCVSLLFLRSTSSTNRRFRSRYTSAANPAADDPRLFHSAWIVSSPGQCMSAMKSASKPSLSMLLPLISRWRRLGWYWGMSCATASAPSRPMMRSLSSSRSLPACSTTSFWMLCLLNCAIQIRKNSELLLCLGDAL